MQAARVKGEPVARRQFRDALRNRAGLGHEADFEQRAQARGIDRAHFAQHRLAGQEIGAEGERGIALRIDEGLLAEAIAGCHNTLVCAVPDREGEHADEARQKTFAPLLPAREQHLGVGAG